MIHVLCNHYQLRYSTIIYYTSKRYSSCRCTLCARCRCSDDINFAPSLSSRGQPRFPFFPLTVLKLAARANANDITKVPRYGKPVHTVTLVRSDVLERAASNIAAELLQCNIVNLTIISRTNATFEQRSSRLPKEPGVERVRGSPPLVEFLRRRAFLNFEGIKVDRSI